MANDEKLRRTGGDLPHNLILEDRAKLSVSGVTDVENFDENTISMVTTEGVLVVRGSELNVEKLNLENGELLIRGQVDSLEYEDRSAARAGLFGRLFG